MKVWDFSHTRFLMLVNRYLSRETNDEEHGAAAEHPVFHQRPFYAWDHHRYQRRWLTFLRWCGQNQEEEEGKERGEESKELDERVQVSLHYAKLKVILWRSGLLIKVKWKYITWHNFDFIQRFRL